MRTAQEAWNYYTKNWAKQEDVFGFMLEALIEFMPYAVAKEVARTEITEEEWDKDVVLLTKEKVIACMKDYMEFAWDKASSHRGISANRSVQKLVAWLMLLGDDDLVRFALNSNNYAMYGAPVLAKICEEYGFPIPNDSLLANMIKGLPCSEYCEEGCN
jgi:hypothetical protein